MTDYVGVSIDTLLTAAGVRRLRFLDEDEPGFWEANGYHMDGDPWRVQRYTGD
jgi:DMSO/TMAO reductase YedYZ molybdopterin-dependent catalytic subunit